MKKRMIKFLTTLLFLALAFIPLSAIGAEELNTPGEGTKAAELDKVVDEDRPELSADAAFLSQYIWRGYAFSKDSLVIQPSITAAFKGFALNLWGNLDTNYDKTGSKWNETDMTFSYGHSFGIVGLEAGYIYYALDGVDDSKEFYLSAGVDVLLAPTLTVYREIASYKGWYINLGLSHSFEMPYDMSLDLGATFAYFKSDNDNGVDYTDDNVATTERYSGLHDGLLSVGLAIPFYKYFTITPSVAWAFPLSSSASNEMSAVSMDGRSNHVFGGITLSMAF
ncbi:MAG: hypothetical protein K9N10_15555 [Deltaproteobacteria bacterium]|nr:hypothetical protein [Deltaproteobacteria bacterium]